MVLGLLLAIGALTQACSDNNGTVGPKFNGGPAATTGFSNTALELAIQVIVNPAVVDIGRRTSIVVSVTNVNGIGIAGKTVRLSASGGILDQASGVTDASGVFSTTMVVPCGTVAAAAGGFAVTAIVDGKVGTGSFTVVTPATNDPCL